MGTCGCLIMYWSFQKDRGRCGVSALSLWAGVSLQPNAWKFIMEICRRVDGGLSWRSAAKCVEVYHGDLSPSGWRLRWMRS